MQRAGVLAPGYSCMWNWYRGEEVAASIQIHAGPDELTLKYRMRTADGKWRPIEYSVRLDWTPCTYGGKRPWLICPAKGCGRRMAKLYLGVTGIFACRHCHRLKYQCQREATHDRAMRRAERIRERLGWTPGIANRPGWKPKGMRWRTFFKLWDDHNAFVRAAAAGWMRRLRALEEHVNRLPAFDGDAA